MEISFGMKITFLGPFLLVIRDWGITIGFLGLGVEDI